MSQRIRVKTFMWPLIGLLSRLRMPWLVSRALLALTQKLDLPFAGSRGNRPRRRLLILSIDKAGVREDIEETFAHAQDYELVVWPSYALRAISGVLLARGLSHDRYLTDDAAVEASKIRYRQFLREVWKRLTRTIPSMP